MTIIYICSWCQKEFKREEIYTGNGIEINNEHLCPNCQKFVDDWENQEVEEGREK